MQRDWADEKAHLLGENAALQDAAKAAVRKATEAEVAGRKAKGNAEAELDKAKKAIAVFEAELKSERGRLRSLNVGQGKAEREKNDVVLQLQRTESVSGYAFYTRCVYLWNTQDMDDVKQQLQRLKQENQDLEKELKGAHESRLITQVYPKLIPSVANTSVKQKTRTLEDKVSENVQTIEQLREERSLLSTNHRELQRQFAQASEVRHPL